MYDNMYVSQFGFLCSRGFRTLLGTQNCSLPGACPSPCPSPRYPPSQKKKSADKHKDSIKNSCVHIS